MWFDCLLGIRICRAAVVHRLVAYGLLTVPSSLSLDTLRPTRLKRNLNLLGRFGFKLEVGDCCNKLEIELEVLIILRVYRKTGAGDDRRF